MQIGKVWLAVDVEAQAFAIVLTRPLAIPHLPPRIIRIEVRAPERLPTAMRTAFNVAARAMAFADTRTAIGTGPSFLLMLVVQKRRDAKRVQPTGGALCSGGRRNAFFRRHHLDGVPGQAAPDRT